MTKQTKQRGFTIVELLIVVVIIAILAAITIVAYNGIQNRAKSSASAAAAASLQKKVEAFAIESASGVYPTTVAALGASSTTSYYLTSAVKPTLTGAVSVDGTLLAAAPADPKIINFYTCASATGYQINYWDFTNGVLKTTSVEFRLAVLSPQADLVKI